MLVSETIPIKLLKKKPTDKFYWLINFLNRHFLR